jgi:hypothetical protein
MSAWDVMEEMLNRSPVSITLSRHEVRVVKEALSYMVREALENTSAWELFENWGTLNETFVTGLLPQEVELLKKLEQGVQSKSGNTGEIVQFTPNTWKKVIDKLNSQSDYYNMLLGGVTTVDDFTQKIEKRLELDMGKAAHQPTKPASVAKPPDLSGDPADPTNILTGPSKFAAEPGATPGQMGGGAPVPQTGAAGGTGGGSPFAKKTGPAAGAPPNPVSTPKPEDAAARRRRVAAQDAAMMGGEIDPKKLKTRPATRQLDPTKAK